MRAIALVLCLAGPALSQAQTESQRVGVTETYRMGAYYDAPTTRYDHGILGDAVEYGQLVVASEHMQAVVTLPETRVFEDIEPRLADIDGDGRPEIVVVETDMELGAQLAVYRASFVDGYAPKIVRLAATAPIGQSHRWLAPAGIADLDGDGQTDIAYVETPHLGKILKIVTLRGDRLVEIGSAPGYSNHHIGDAHIAGGVRRCDGLAELILPTGDWQRIEAVRIYKGEILATDLGPYEGRTRLAALMHCN